MTPSVSEQAWVQPDFSAIAFRIQHGDSAAESELVTKLTRGIRFAVSREVDPTASIDGIVEEVLKMVIDDLHRGRLQDPQHLLAHVRSVLKSVVRRHCDVGSSGQRGTATAEQSKRRKSLAQALSSFSESDREALRRYYVNGRTREQVCQEMGLTEVAFNSIQDRVRSRFKGAASKHQHSGSSRSQQ